MPRDLPQSFRRLVESRYGGDALLWFLTLSHPRLSEPVRVNWDSKDYIWNGETYIGFPFDFVLLSDDETPPRARLQIQNIDPRIGDSIRRLASAPRLRFDLLTSADFNIDVDPRTAGSPEPDPIYTADQLFLANVKVDALAIGGDIVGWDYLQRVWPGPRATQSLLPGLFR